ncbi:hypothetical protein [Halobacteriovorax sp. HLS]|uniref:hypothetical protein n=1 Tax=Halobacteriovorax sp. HLS TaxID=2234000 RepID=UPI000FDB6F71|nr:hypothetical protein [Halobacteriovorax sp. HLS]
MRLFHVLLFFISISISANEWKFLQTYEGVDLYELQNSSEYATPFKAIGTIPVDISSVIKSLLDIDKKHEWAPKLKSVELHKDLGKNTFIFSEYYRTPWPYYDRQFLLMGELKKEGRTVTFKAKNYKDEKLIHDDHVLASVEILDFVLEEVSGGTKITFTFNGDMGGWIPSFVSNIIRKKWPLRFIQALERLSKSGKIRTTDYYINYMKSIEN